MLEGTCHPSDTGVPAVVTVASSIAFIVHTCSFHCVHLIVGEVLCSVACAAHDCACGISCCTCTETIWIAFILQELSNSSHCVLSIAGEMLGSVACAAHHCRPGISCCTSTETACCAGTSLRARRWAANWNSLETDGALGGGGSSMGAGGGCKTELLDSCAPW